MFTKISKMSALVVAALLFSSFYTSVAAAQHSKVCFHVALRGGTSEICADVYDNPGSVPVGATVLTVHGFTETALVWQPLKNALFADKHFGRFVKRLIAVDLPGHGDSEAPIGLPGGLFGQVTIFDNISVIIQSIDILAAQGIGPTMIMGHSMGGLEVAGAQETLLSAGSSLAAHGVTKAVLLAPVPVDNVTWTQPPPSDLSAFVVFDPLLGAYLDLPPAIARIGGFTTRSGILVSGAPSLEQMVDYVGWEPIVTTLQLVGQIPGLPRPSARQGAFAAANGTLLGVVSFSEDVLTPADDLDELYLHLNGGPGLLYRRVEGPEAVHSMYISDPVGVLAAVKTMQLTF